MLFVAQPVHSMRVARIKLHQLMRLNASYPGVAVALPVTAFSSAFKTPLPALSAAAVTTEVPEPELPPELEPLAELEPDPDPDTGDDFADDEPAEAC